MSKIFSSLFNNSSVVLALGMTLPFLLTAVHALWMYGNVPNNNIGMGGLEDTLFLAHIAVPLFLICLVIFVLRLIYRHAKHLPLKRDVQIFLITLCVVGGLGVLTFSLGNFCFRSPGYCTFVPVRSYN